MEQENKNYDKELLFNQYKLYYEMKERFVDRNFTTNKYYIVIVILIFVVMFFTRDIKFDYQISANLIMSILGMAISFFWWSNVDVYNIMIKIKMKNVIDEMEKQLPLPIHLIEMKEFSKYKKQNKMVIFSDMQKGIAICMFLMFFIIFLIQMIDPIIGIFFSPAEVFPVEIEGNILK